MKERPILFSTEMVRALLGGRKTQTRRVIKPQPKEDGWTKGCVTVYDHDYIPNFCPYGQVGDRLYVRESCQFALNRDGTPDKTSLMYKADISDADLRCVDCDWDWHTSMFMPRWASRITLEITGVKVERLNDITEEDAISEGLLYWEEADSYATYPINNLNPEFTRQPILAYQTLWDSINGKKYPWSSNPWVWIISFKRV